MGKLLSWFCITAVSVSAVSSLTIAEIQGSGWQSPYNGQTVRNVTGVVSAKVCRRHNSYHASVLIRYQGLNGFWLAGQRSTDVRNSSGIYVYTTSATIQDRVKVGDSISLTGKVTEYKSPSSPTHLSLTELMSPADIVVGSSNNRVSPVILGKDRSPPTRHFSALDAGADGFLSVPNNSSRIEEVNARLQPTKYGLDFWESLEGQLVTIPGPTSLGFPNNYGEFWVYGDWTVTGKNKRGGLTINIGTYLSLAYSDESVDSPLPTRP